MKQERPYLDWKDFMLSVVAAAYVNEASVKAMATFLNDCGVIVWFDVPTLRDIVVVDPQWLATLMASLVSFKVTWRFGIVKYTDLHGAWKHYGQDYVSTFAQLMEH